jgi:hypothetical protein
MAFRPFPGQNLSLRRFALHTLDEPHSVEPFWTSDHPDTGTSIWQHTAVRRDKLSNPAYQQTCGCRPTQWQLNNVVNYPLVLPATGVIHNMLNQGPYNLNLPPCPMSQVQKVVTKFQIIIIIKHSLLCNNRRYIRRRIYISYFCLHLINTKRLWTCSKHPVTCPKPSPYYHSPSTHTDFLKTHCHIDISPTSSSLKNTLYDSSEKIIMRGRSLSSRGLRRWCAPLACWDSEFEFWRVHGGLRLVIVVCCQVKVFRRADPSSKGVLPSLVCLIDSENSTVGRPWHTISCSTELRVKYETSRYLILNLI